MPARQFIDLFAGCGGLSLGLSQAGWQGAFAIEREPMAFETYSANFLAGPADLRVDWPGWLEQRPWAIQELLSQHGGALRGLRGRVRLVAGGPPCQGFSFAGRRQKLDPRNMLFKKYVDVVDAVRPDVLLVENVPGMRVAHGAKLAAAGGGRGRPREPYSERLSKALRSLDYDTRVLQIDASAFGVPQRRPRIFIVGVRRCPDTYAAGGVQELVNLVERYRAQQLVDLGLSMPVTTKDAIGDLETKRNGVVPCVDPASPTGFVQPDYRGPLTVYQRMMRGPLKGNEIDSARLARHSAPVSKRFGAILEECRQGVTLHLSDRQRLGIKKYRVHPMSSRMSAPTITTLPDDILHYSEPRILSVRECARLQSFPDWFVFRGKYTTGGSRRAKECPRYTQVGNAVPPLVGRAMGISLAAFLDAVEQQAIPARRAVG